MARGSDPLCAAWGADAGPETETRIHHLARHAPGLESALHRPGCGALPDVLEGCSEKCLSREFAGVHVAFVPALRGGMYPPLGLELFA